MPVDRPRMRQGTRALLSNMAYTGMYGYGPRRTPNYLNRTRNNGTPNNTLTYARGTRGRRGGFRQKMLSYEPCQHSIVSDNTINTAVLHGTVYTFGPTQIPAQGTAIGNRVGDQIELIALKLRGQFITNASSNVYTYRIIVGWSGNEVAATSLTSGLGVTDVFFPNTYSVNICDGIVNPKAFTCLYDETVVLNSQITATQDGEQFAITVPFKEKFPYRAGAATMGKFKQLYVVVCANVAGGTVGVTNAGSVYFSSDLLFKNA